MGSDGGQVDGEVMAAAVEDDVEVLRSLPPATMVWGYGSGVVPQARDLGEDGDAAAPAQRLRDYILVVEDARAWHAENMRRHPTHYPWWMRSAGARVVRWVQRTGAAAYFVPLLPSKRASAIGGSSVADASIKYGVIEAADLLQDLVTWRHFYIAGRLHKPAVRLPAIESTEATARAHAEALWRAQRQHNLLNATRLALLASVAEDAGASVVPLSALLERIAGLSYLSDIRFRLGLEPSDKVWRIVQPNFARFAEIYCGPIGTLAGQGLLQVVPYAGTRATSRDEPVLADPDDLLDFSPLTAPGDRGMAALSKLVNPLLALDPFQSVAERTAIVPAGPGGRLIPPDDPLTQVRPALALACLTALRRRVMWRSIAQAGKGLASAGFGRSIAYLQRKWRSGRRRGGAG